MEHHNREEPYELEDLDGLLDGTVVAVRERYGFVKPDHLLPKPYKRNGDIFFTLHPDAMEHVEIGQRAVFILNKDSYDKTSVTEITFATDSTDSPPVSFFYVPGDRIPFIDTDCGHICFWNNNEDDREVCLRNCLQALSCGHVCKKKCKEPCPRECYLCEKKRKDSEKYQLEDLGGFLYGTVVNIQEAFGFVKPERGLPAPYNSRKEIYFSRHETDMTAVREGQRAVFLLKMDDPSRPAARGPAARKIAFFDEGVDKSILRPFIREECGHICFKRARDRRASCPQKCSRKMVCGHICNRLCSDLCLSECEECTRMIVTAMVFFDCDGDDVQIGHITFVGEGHGYIKSNKAFPGQSNQKTGVYFSFDETNAELIERGVTVIFVLQNPTAEKLETTQLALIDKDTLYCRRIKNRVRPKTWHMQSTGETPVVERLEVEAANGISNRIFRHHLSPSRQLNFNDPRELNFRIAESQFLRLAQKSRKQYELESVTYYINPQLVRRFRAKRAAFERIYGKGEKSTDVLAFHGTKDYNIDQIIRENFKLEYCHRSLYGKGIYLSEFPQVSIDYGRSLLLCKVLPGNSCDVTRMMTDAPSYHGYNSNRVNADKDGYGWALVVDDPDQILPCYVINYREIPAISDRAI